MVILTLVREKHVDEGQGMATRYGMVSETFHQNLVEETRTTGVRESRKTVAEERRLRFSVVDRRRDDHPPWSLDAKQAMDWAVREVCES